jgi:hypothetical protein
VVEGGGVGELAASVDGVEETWMRKRILRSTHRLDVEKIAEASEQTF